MMNSNLPDSPPASDLVVVLPDGRRAAVPEGEFRSLEGKLLFVRRGDRLEIRCPRSKALYAVEVTGECPPPSKQDERNATSSPAS